VQQLSVSIPWEEHWRTTDPPVESRPAHKERLKAALQVAELREQKGSCAATCWAPWRGWFPLRPLCHIVKSEVLKVEPLLAPARPPSPDDGGGGRAVAIGGVAVDTGVDIGAGAGNTGDSLQVLQPHMDLQQPIGLLQRMGLQQGLQQHMAQQQPISALADISGDLTFHEDGCGSQGRTGALPRPGMIYFQSPPMARPIPSVDTPERPPHWTPGNRKRVPLDPASDEYNQAVAHFLRSAGDRYIIEGIERVQIQGQWDMYQSKKREMMGRGVFGADERLLFHGTDEAAANCIALTSFNRSLCGKNATAYGQGVYFARDASYSADNTYSRPNADGVKHVFLSRVLVGTYAKGDSSMRTPPNKAVIVCDTTVDNTVNPTIFVAYNDAQVGRVDGGGQFKAGMSGLE
jgi:hypothetical protein